MGAAVAEKVYLDDSGNPLKIYLDDNGNPIAAPQSAAPAKPRGATGSWDAPSLNERAGAAVTKFTEDHPVISAPLNFLVGAGKAATDLVAGIPSMPGAVYHAATDPLTDEENKRHLGSTGGIGVLTDRLVRPMIEGAKQEYQERGLSGVAGMAMTFGVAPKVAEESLPVLKAGAEKAAAIPRTGADMLSDAFKPKDPVVTTMRGFNIKDPNVTKWGPKALDEVGQWSDQNGPVRDTPTLRTALRDQMDANNAIAEPVIKQQSDIVVPGSRAEAARIRIESIPEEIRLDEPVKYDRLVKEARALTDQPDYTIGELNDLRQSLGAKNKTYGKNLSGQISADHSMMAMDHAQESWARAKLYDALQENSGSGIDVKELKSRMGAMIKLDDAAFKKVNQSMIESGKRLPEKAIELAGKAMTPGTTLKHFGDNATIDSDIASAVRQWKRRPSQILAPTPKLPAPDPVSSRLALPPAAGQFQIDPSAAPLYGMSASDQIRSMTMKPAEEGGGIPMRDVTPPKQKMLPAAPLTASRILRPSGETFKMGAPVSGLIPERNPVPGRQLAEPSKLYRAEFVDPPSGKVYNMPPKTVDLLQKYVDTQRRIASGAGSGSDALLSRSITPQVLLHRMAQNLMDDFMEAADEHDGATLKGFSREQTLSSHRGLSLEEQMNMNAEAEAAYTEHLKDYDPTEHSIKKGTVFEQFPEGPKAIIKAIRSRKGKLYGQIIKAVWDEVESYAKQKAPDVFPAERNFTSETEDWFN